MVRLAIRITTLKTKKNILAIVAYKSIEKARRSGEFI